MTFYNPNIQGVFDNNSSLDIVFNNFFISKKLLATYQFCFDNSPFFDISNSSSDDQTYTGLLRFVSSIQLANLGVVDANFFACFLDIAIKSYQLHISSFADYLLYSERSSYATSYFENEYLKDRIFDFIELLLYSNIANVDVNCNRHNYQMYLDNQNATVRFPVYTTLYERLKLFNYLFDNIRFQVSNICISPVSSIIHFDFSLRL